MFADKKEELNKNLEELNKRIEKQNSLKFIILRGIVYGVSTVIGASIVAGIVISILSATIDSVEEVPILNTIVEEIPVEEVR